MELCRAVDCGDLISSGGYLNVFSLGWLTIDSRKATVDSGLAKYNVRVTIIIDIKPVVFLEGKCFHILCWSPLTLLISHHKQIEMIISTNKQGSM